MVNVHDAGKITIANIKKQRHDTDFNYLKHVDPSSAGNGRITSNILMQWDGFVTIKTIIVMILYKGRQQTKVSSHTDAFVVFEKELRTFEVEKERGFMKFLMFNELCDLAGKKLVRLYNKYNKI